MGGGSRRGVGEGQWEVKWEGGGRGAVGGEVGGGGRGAVRGEVGGGWERGSGMDE